MIAAIYDLLRADSAFMAPLTGGLHNADTVGEISRQSTPDAFDADGRLRPCGLVVAGTAATDKSFNRIISRAARQYVRLFLYQRGGRDQIYVARNRAFALLHQRQDLALPEGFGRCSELFWLDDVLDQIDVALNTPIIVSRYQATLVR